jgi:hypothetical protein
MHIPRLASLALAAALAAFALPARAAYLRVHADPSSMTALDSGKPDKNLSGDAFSKVLVNYEGGEISAKGVTAVLLRLPDALLSAQPADLARATLVFHVLKANNWQPDVFSPRLFPLAAPYAFSEATWNDSAAGTPWTAPGGDTLDAFVDGTYDARSQTLSFNLLPLLSDPDAAAALSANGALLRLAWDELPDSGFSMLNLHNTQAAAENLPDAYFVLGAPDATPTGTLLAMTALDSGKPNANLSGDAFSKVLVNYEDGEISSKGVTAAVLQLPEALLSADAANLSRATLVFNVLKANNWQPDVFSPRLFPLATPYAFSEVTWNNSAAETPWTTPGGDTLDAFVDGAYDDSSKTLSFDILPLLTDADASAALAANGALVRLAWDALPDSGFSMLNLHNTQAAADLLPSASWRFASAEVGPADAVADVPTAYYIDGSAEALDSTFFSTPIRFIINADDTRGDTRVLVALPDIDLPTVAALGALHFDAELNWRSNPTDIPACANVLTTPLGTTDSTASTWNRPDRSQTNTWNGGDFADTLSFPAVFGDASIDFDLSPLLASDLRDAAFTNGLVLRWTGEARETITNTHIRHVLKRETSTLAWTQRPVVHSYIDSGKPGNNFGWSGATDSKCIVLLNPGDGEARTLVKFAPSFFNFDPAQDTALLLTFPYGKEWPGEDEPNQIALQPLATPFRMGQATWNMAADGAPWTTPGGDLDETVSFVGAVDRDAQTITFDLTSLYFDPAARDEMIQNGAALRILGDHPVEAGSVGFNFGKSGGPVAIAIAADGVEFRGFSIDYPAAAEAESAAKDASEGPTCSLDLTGLDPTVDYAVYACSDLAAGEWTWLCDVPDDGQVAFPATGSISFFRVQPRE